MATSQQMMPGSISFGGTGMGTGNTNAFRAPNPGQSIQDQIESELLRLQSLRLEVSNNSFTLPRTGDNSFDKTYQDGVVAYIGKSHVPIYKDPSQLIVNTQQEAPSLSSISYAIDNRESTSEFSSTEVGEKEPIFTEEGFIKEGLKEVVNPVIDFVEEKAGEKLSEWSEKVKGVIVSPLPNRIQGTLEAGEGVSLFVFSFLKDLPEIVNRVGAGENAVKLFEAGRYVKTLWDDMIGAAKTYLGKSKQ
jgi:hypothetical protein